MIQIYVPVEDKQHLPWKAQLVEWCIAHEVIIDDSLPCAELREKEVVHRDEASVNKFLKEYKEMYDEWNDCRCDKWMDG